MKILIVDDEKMQRDLLAGFLIKQGFDIVQAADGREALEQLKKEVIQLVLLDHRMPDMMGDAVLARMKAFNPFVRAIMITAYGSVETAVTVMKLGADDFIEKPVDLKRLLEKIRRLEEAVTLSEEVIEVTQTLDRAHLPVQIVGDSPEIKNILSLSLRVAPTPWPVLISGETGTGKELFARLIHLLSGREENPLVGINCGAIPENLFESELFGHEKGAFTGAVHSRRGRFESADSGTLFLDEIGEMPLHLQPKLLRAIQENRIIRVGGEKEIALNIRVLAATNRDLREEVKMGRFREDLYFRLKVFEMQIPPLRQRKGDLPKLIEFFIGRYGSKTVQFTSEALTVLGNYTFPGNVRELEHIIQRTVTLARGNIIRPQDLPAEVRYHTATSDGSLSHRLRALERELIVSALDGSNWVQTRAADSLGISERVLRYKMKKHGIPGAMDGR